MARSVIFMHSPAMPELISKVVVASRPVVLAVPPLRTSSVISSVIFLVVAVAAAVAADANRHPGEMPFMDLPTLVQTIANSVVAGSVYAVIAVGLAMAERMQAAG